MESGEARLRQQHERGVAERFGARGGEIKRRGFC